MTRLPPDEAKAMLASMLADFAENDLGNLGPYLEHCGFDAGALGKPGDLLPAWLGHYRIGQGTYDTERALLDFMTWPPIARRILELQQEKLSFTK